MACWFIQTIKNHIITHNPMTKIGNISQRNYGMAVFFRTHIVNQINNPILQSPHIKTVHNMYHQKTAVC